MLLEFNFSLDNMLHPKPQIVPNLNSISLTMTMSS